MLCEASSVSGVNVPSIRDLDIMARRMASLLPLRRWGRDVPVCVGLSPLDCDWRESKMLIGGVGHVHPGDTVIVHVERYYLDALTLPDSMSPLEVLADAWAVARKPFYAPEKRGYWREKMITSYRRKWPA